LFSDEIVFVVARSHALAARKTLNLVDLQSHLLLTSNAAPAESQHFMKQVFGRARPRLQGLKFYKRAYRRVT
jgi:LysR family transcriptional regulator for metE and metH